MNRWIETDHVAFNRRRFLAIAGSIAGSAILAACGGSSAPDIPPAVATSVAPTVNAAAMSAAPTVASAATSAAPTINAVATSVAPTVNAAATQAGSAVAGIAPTVASAATSGAPTVNAAATSVAPTVASAATSVAPTVNAAITSAVPTVNAVATQAGTTVVGIAPTVVSAATSAAPTVNAVSSSVASVGTSAAGSVVTTGSAASGTTVPGSVTTNTGGQMLVIEATEYSFKSIGSISAGVTTVQLKNLGKENHEAEIVRLNDGVTVEQFLIAVQQAGQGEPPPIFTYEGGPAEITQGKTGEVMLDLQAGQYMLLCFINGPDGMSHAAKGMVLPLKVNTATGSASALPTGKGTITLGTASGFELPASLPTGRSQYRVTNQGMGPHAFFVGSIPADKTIDDVNAELAKQDAPPPPWFTPSGGMDGLKPNGTGVVTLDLMPGKYVAVDVPFGPDKPFGKVFTVA